ncbi:DNA binding domain-containing protein, excisionase family [Fodinibius roseus]|uniref:DNA binding domain-containing protein, excisionase family n=1 Tax=Fodinibius roseus TaxID=1194090 RepID=A0A1M5K137_9BACT|nr:helix-turn-helix domain-containing protein [Fodinibius roseus]SHG46240.1 DNA binding domain-containing protein, excisionase family [Fodinibius roseus]
MKQSELLTRQDLDEFKQEFMDILETKLKAAINEIQLNKRWLRTGELAEYLSLSTSQISVLKAEGVIKARKLGGTNYFNKIEIDEYLQNQGETYV